MKPPSPAEKSSDSKMSAGSTLWPDDEAEEERCADPWVLENWVVVHYFGEFFCEDRMRDPGSVEGFA